jgi:hypothetical protein
MPLKQRDKQRDAKNRMVRPGRPPCARDDMRSISLFFRIPANGDERFAHIAGIGLMLLSILMFSFGDALGKFLVATYSVGQLLWLRASAALIVLSPMIWRNRAAFLQLERPWLQLLRVVLSTLEVAAFFLATVYLPLADVVTYYLACPIFLPHCRRPCCASGSAGGAGARY